MSTNIEEVIVPEGIAGFSYSVFNNCSSLKTIVLPSSLKTIGQYSFQGCTSLEKVFYLGDKTSWNSITIKGDNELLISATKYFYSEEEPAESGNYWHYVDGIPTIW